MKNIKKLFGITAFITVIIFSMTAATCGGGGKGGNAKKTAKEIESVDTSGNAIMRMVEKLQFEGEGWTLAEIDYESVFDTYLPEAIAFGAGKFVAGGHGGKMAYSSDGAKWTAVTDSTFGTTRINRIVYGSNKFVAVDGDDSGKMAYSTDGIKWTAVKDMPFSYIRAIAYGKNKFVAVGYDEMAYSADGIKWTAVNDSKLDYIITIAFGGGKFVAVGNEEMAYSTDGIKWTAVKDVPFYINAIAYGSNKFVAVGDSGKMAYSTDGIKWTAVKDVSFGNSIFYVNNKFIAYNMGKMASSKDGVKWTDIPNAFKDMDAVGDIAYGNGKLVAVSDFFGKIAYSTGK